MGAHSIVDVAVNTADPRQAFTELVEKARAEFGYDPYNGTISTIDGFQRSPHFHDPIPESALDWVERQVWDRQHQGDLPEIQKWESCLAIPLAADDQFDWTEKTVEIKVGSDARSYPSPSITKAVKELVGEQAIVSGIAWETVEAGGEPEIEESDQNPTAGGFIVLFRGDRMVGRINATREEAIEEARREALRRNPMLEVDETRKMPLEVVEISPASYSCQKKEALDTYSVTYRLAVPKPNPEIKGWAFFGYAAS